jgi:magnesium and cobalt transporter
MFLVDARALIEELEELVGAKLILDEEDEDLDTVGGLIFTMIDRVPERGELITHPRGLEFEVLDADPRRVKKVRIRIKSSSRPQTSSSVEASQPDAASKISR